MSCPKCGAPSRSSTSSWCKAHHNEWARNNWKTRTPEQKRAKWLKSNYGLTYQEYESLYKSQNGKCALCLSDISIDTKKGANSACVDHCHTTGKVRGMLCNHCNRALGFLKDNLETVERIKEYLT